MNSVGQYSGTTTNTLNVSNVTLINNNQPFRCVVHSGSCYDTSIVAVLTVASPCSNNTSISPITNYQSSGNTATFTATTSDPNPSYVWQSDLGQGFQSLNNYGNYTGTNTANLSIANVQLANQNQPIRVITTSGNCIDTSVVASISISDTCISTVTDTTLITVIDTLIINTNLTGINPPNNINSIRIFP